VKFIRAPIRARAAGILGVIGVTLGALRAPEDPNHQAAQVALLALAAQAGVPADAPHAILLNGVLVPDFDSAVENLVRLPKPLACSAAAGAGEFAIACGPIPVDLLGSHEAWASTGGSWERRIRGMAQQEHGELGLRVVAPSGLTVEIELRALSTYLRDYHIHGGIALGELDHTPDGVIEVFLEPPPRAEIDTR
jgi:hypothetical protein